MSPKRRDRVSSDEAARLNWRDENTIAFSRNLIKFFSWQMGISQNVALAFGIAMELTLTAIMFYASDGEKKSEDFIVALWRKKESTPNYDAIIAGEEFS